MSESEVLANYSYTPWGCMRDYATLEPAAPGEQTYDNQQVSWFHRGFTGHEMLFGVDLINMNGRIYDPYTCRFVSTDNYVQAPGFSQSFNRYSYCWNNPLVYTDPDGEWVHLVVGGIVVGGLNLAMNWNNIDNFGEGLAIFAVGAGAGVLTAATGGTAAGTFMASTGAGVGAAVIGGAATSSVNNIVSQTNNTIGINQVNWSSVGKMLYLEH